MIFVSDFLQLLPGMPPRLPDVPWRHDAGCALSERYCV